MLATRVMPVILCDGARAVVSRQFATPRRPIGSVVAVTQLFEARTVDEIVLLAVDGPMRPGAARAINDLLRTPLLVGGGIETAEEAIDLVRAGADRVIVGRAAATVIPAVARTLGSQAVVGAVDARDVPSAAERARHLANLGAGEILLQCVARDGTMSGPDLDLIGAVTHAVDVPVVYAGGIGSATDAVEAVLAGASAVAAAAMFAFTDVTPTDVKVAMREAGIPVRMSSGALSRAPVHSQSTQGTGR